MATRTIVEILNSSLEPIYRVRSMLAFDREGTILQYNKELSDYGTCRFRVSTKDSGLIAAGDIFVPHRYHVRIRKGLATVWQGAIVDNPQVTGDYIEVLAAEYEFYLSKVLVTRSSPDPNGTGQTDVYRVFNSGTMADAVTTIMNETKTKFQNSNHILANMTIGTVENPNYPPNMTSSYQNGTQTFPLSGGWQFGQETATSLGPTIIYDYHTIQYILKSFGIYSYADHQVTSDLTFNFKSFIGNNLQTSLTFRYGQSGLTSNIIDFNVPRLGKRMANSIYGIATDNNGSILHANPSDQTSIGSYGLLEEVAAYSDVKTQGLLQARIAAELPLVSSPDQTNAIIYLNEKGYPLGQYDIGDIVTVDIEDGNISVKGPRRIVGITVLENQTGRERIAIQTNIPLPWQLPSSGDIR